MEEDCGGGQGLSWAVEPRWGGGGRGCSSLGASSLSYNMKVFMNKAPAGSWLLEKRSCSAQCPWSALNMKADQDNVTISSVLTAAAKKRDASSSQVRYMGQSNR
jgi:hypothetical protein